MIEFFSIIIIITIGWLSSLFLERKHNLLQFSFRQMKNVVVVVVKIIMIMFIIMNTIPFITIIEIECRK